MKKERERRTMAQDTQEHLYQQVFAPYSEEEIAKIVMLKRVFEWVQES
jgi:hypothetical protein